MRVQEAVKVPEVRRDVSGSCWGGRNREMCSPSPLITVWLFSRV